MPSSSLPSLPVRLRAATLWAALLTGVGLFSAVPACISEDPGPPAEPCELYCTEIARTCGGDKAQYRGKDECLKVCSLLELGNPSDGDVNSVNCRIRRARSAATLEDCVAAGPFGGGVCGARCSSFCTIVEKTCLAIASPPFGGSAANCAEVCPSFKLDPTEGEGPNQTAFPGKDTLNCREHHLILAIGQQVPHCSHADVVSSQCK